MNQTIENNVREILEMNIASATDFKNFPIDQSLSEAGFNSVDLIKVAVGLETTFEFELGDDELNFDDFDSIEKIIKFVDKKKS